jgi:hypothetical protein
LLLYRKSIRKTHASWHEFTIPERIPNAVLRLDGSSAVSICAIGSTLDCDALLAIYGVSGGQIFGNEQIFLRSTSNKDSCMTVRLDNDLLPTSGTKASSTTASWSTFSEKK